MSDFFKHLKDGWQVLLILGTLIGLGVGWTSYLQSNIVAESRRAEISANERYFPKNRGELLEQRAAFHAETQREMREAMKQITANQQLILRHLERLEERNGRAN